MGCRLTVTAEDGDEGIISVIGNKCKRGEAYAIEEMTNPTRMLPTTMIIKGGLLKRLPVRTEKPIPKELLFEAMKKIDEVIVEAPVKRGDVVIRNLLGTGVNVIASRSMKHI
jgi:CxxC motif-containing protein